MASQEYKSPRRRDDEPDDADVPEPAPSGSSQEVSDSSDDVLDEIDGVLESNAEEFVRGFVQKGGE